MTRIESYPTLQELSRGVKELLCEHDSLDPEQSPCHCAVVTRGGRPCGLYFEVEGPRLLRVRAIWAEEENRILFYDSNGARFQEVRLTESPDSRALLELFRNNSVHAAS